MKTSKLNLPHIKLQIANWIANGYSQREIAQALQTNQPAIFRMAHKTDVQEMIAQETERLCHIQEQALLEAANDPLVKAAFKTWAMNAILGGVLSKKEIQNVLEVANTTRR